MSNLSTTDFYSMVDMDLREKLIPKIKNDFNKSSEISEWMENNLHGLLKEDLNIENYHVAIQKSTILSKMKGGVYENDARNGYKGFVKSCAYSEYINYYKEFLEMLDLDKPNPAIDSLPKYSFFIQFKFKLRKPFYSHDDEVLYVIDNPVTKEHVFKLPMMRPSGWKGNLRSTIIKSNNLQLEYESNSQIEKLFGFTEINGQSQKKGRLIFYPTYFDKIGLEVINPHDRKTKAGTNPILYEVVPEGSSGIFSLLYIPFDLIGFDDAKRRREALADLGEIFRAVKEMMTVYGFGAKTSSGFGVIDDNIENCVVNINGINLSNSEISTIDKFDLNMEEL